jgi:hypothetical protein
MRRPGISPQARCHVPPSHALAARRTLTGCTRHSPAVQLGPPPACAAREAVQAAAGPRSNPCADDHRSALHHGLSELPRRPPRCRSSSCVSIPFARNRSSNIPSPACGPARGTYFQPHAAASRCGVETMEIAWGSSADPQGESGPARRCTTELEDLRDLLNGGALGKRALDMAVDTRGVQVGAGGVNGQPGQRAAWFSAKDSARTGPPSPPGSPSPAAPAPSKATSTFKMIKRQMYGRAKTRPALQARPARRLTPITTIEPEPLSHGHGQRLGPRCHPSATARGSSPHQQKTVSCTIRAAS